MLNENSSQLLPKNYYKNTSFIKAIISQRTLFVFFILFGLSLSVYSQKNIIHSFPLSSVRLLKGPFKEAEQVDLNYMTQLVPDKLLAPFLIEAGLPPKAAQYPNWEETGLGGHTAGHYLTALALMYASTGSEEAGRRLTYMVEELGRCQQKNGNGYVGGIPGGNELWKDVAAGKLTIERFAVNKKWVPWYNIHKLYAGLRDAYLFAANQQAKDILVKLSDWCFELTSHLSDEQMQEMLKAEYGGMNEVLADVYVITGNKKHLDLAKRFSHKVILDPLLQHQDNLTMLHANTQIPKVIGFERIAALTGDTAQESAAAFFWETVVNNRSVSFGGNSVKEHFNPVNDFSSMLESKEGPETCNTYNMLKLSKGLYTSSGALKYIDYYERALYNHILSSQHPEGGFVYFTPIRPRHYRVYSQPQTSFWCCVGSGMENHGKYGELIYAHTDHDLFVNLFISSKLNWKEKGIQLVQETNFPEEETSTLKLTVKKPMVFTLNLRYPSWVRKGSLKILVNGKVFNVQADPSSYVAINRKWKDGDIVSLNLPMETTMAYLPDNSPWVSFLHGPIVLAAKTDTTDLKGLMADDGRMGHIAKGPYYPLEKAPLLVSNDKDLSAKVIPVKNKKLTFTATELIYPDNYKNLELVPFFKVHDARYVMYWHVTSPAKLEKMQAETREKEKVKMALEAQTIDQVAPGEQQPESDHNFQGDKTETGFSWGRYWRIAEGWFSYDLKDKNKEASILQVTYYGADKNRKFDVIINNSIIATQELNGSNGKDFFNVNYAIADELIQKAKNNILTVKFAAHKESIAGGVFYVRLLKKPLK